MPSELNKLNWDANSVNKLQYNSVIHLKAVHTVYYHSNVFERSLLCLPYFGILLQFKNSFYSNIFENVIHFCIGKYGFSAVITQVFVTWTFRNHSNLVLIYLLWKPCWMFFWMFEKNSIIVMHAWQIKVLISGTFEWKWKWHAVIRAEPQWCWPVRAAVRPLSSCWCRGELTCKWWTHWATTCSITPNCQAAARSKPLSILSFTDSFLSQVNSWMPMWCQLTQFGCKAHIPNYD